MYYIWITHETCNIFAFHKLCKFICGKWKIRSVNNKIQSVVYLQYSVNLCGKYTTELLKWVILPTPSCLPFYVTKSAINVQIASTLCFCIFSTFFPSFTFFTMLWAYHICSIYEWLTLSTIYSGWLSLRKSEQCGLTSSYELRMQYEGLDINDAKPYVVWCFCEPHEPYTVYM